MVNAIDLIFLKKLGNAFVECARGLLVASKWFLDDNTRPYAIFAVEFC